MALGLLFFSEFYWTEWDLLVIGFAYCLFNKSGMGENVLLKSIYTVKL